MLNTKENINYFNWINKVDQESKKELEKINESPEEIQNRFYKDLKFGTGGLRGKIGIGSNRVNQYTISKATQGLANYINSLNIDNPSVAIAYDTRFKSDEFSKNAASVLAANGIKVKLFKDSRPTPELSYAIRYFKCDLGIVITASHNPLEYNGYKVYEQNGVQIVPKIADKIIIEINQLDIFEDIKQMDFDKALDNGLVEYVLEDIEESYLKYIENHLFNGSLLRQTNLSVLYTALHGTGAKPIDSLITKLGLKNYYTVKEQMKPDPNFSTVKVPNPEEKESFTLAIKKAKENNCDLILGTDPDCDRVGVLVKKGEEYKSLNGNQIGALLINYILENMNNIPEKGMIIKTIVTSDLGVKIAKTYGLEYLDTLTGFKYIGEKIGELEKENKSFIFGYEESYGYLYGTEVRDKDAVISSLLIIEMAVYYYSKNKNLFDVLEDLYEKFGYYEEKLISRKYEGKAGEEKINQLMSTFRSQVMTFSSYEIIETIDYLKDDTGLPKSNVLKFNFKGGGWFVVRPSGTEPKIKFYISLRGENKESLIENIRILEKEIFQVIE